MSPGTEFPAPAAPCRSRCQTGPGAGRVCVSGGKKGVRGAWLQLGAGEESTGKTHTMGRSTSCPAGTPSPLLTLLGRPVPSSCALREETEGTDRQRSVSSGACRGDEAAWLSPPEPLSAQLVCSVASPRHQSQSRLEKDSHWKARTFLHSLQRFGNTQNLKKKNNNNKS